MFYSGVNSYDFIQDFVYYVVLVVVYLNCEELRWIRWRLFHNKVPLDMKGCICQSGRYTLSYPRGRHVLGICHPLWSKGSYLPRCDRYNTLLLNPSTARRFNFYFHQLEVVSRWCGGETQLQVCDNYLIRRPEGKCSTTGAGLGTLS